MTFSVLARDPRTGELGIAVSSCILAVGGSKPTVVPVDGMIGVKTMMTVNLTADHRHINGDVAASFLKTLKAVIEDPKDLVY